jgi:uncharacterized protein YxeA
MNKVILLIVFTLAIFGTAFYFYLPVFNEVTVNKQRAQSYREYEKKEEEKKNVEEENKIEPQNTEGKNYSGVYVFNETGEQNSGSALVYRLTLLQENNEYIGYLDIDGYQTMNRFKVDVLEKSGFFSIKLNSYLKSNISEIYAVGDTLFNLDKTNPEKMKISWGSMTPSWNNTDLDNTFFEKFKGISFSTTENDLLVMNNGKLIQTLTLDKSVVEMLSTENPYINDAQFIFDKDINFDGYVDVALITGVGYGGVNIFYDYYLYDPKTSIFQKDPILFEISNPQIDTMNKKVTSSFRSGPQWYSQTFQWNGNRYVASEPIVQ